MKLLDIPFGVFRIILLFIRQHSLRTTCILPSNLKEKIEQLYKYPLELKYRIQITLDDADNPREAMSAGLRAEGQWDHVKLGGE